MGKNVYSLVLSDEVVSEVDRLAYKHNTNRSNMINQILADYLSLVTPEQHVKQVFEKLSEILSGSSFGDYNPVLSGRSGFHDEGGASDGSDAEAANNLTLSGNSDSSIVRGRLCEPDTFKFILTQSDSIMSLRSALAYKYNPTVRYSIELYREAGPSIGELRVSLRTQNVLLIRYVTDFFKLWTRLENDYTDSRNSVIEDGRFARQFVIPESTAGMPDSEYRSSSRLGELIAEYVSMFDRALKLFFKNLDNPKRTVPEIKVMQNRYFEKLKRGTRK